MSETIENTFYQVEVVLDNKRSRRVGDLGNKKARTLVNGAVLTEEGFVGIEGATIKMSFSNGEGPADLYAQTTTNSSGYYEFKNVPSLELEPGYDSIYLEVVHPNARFKQAQKSFTLVEDQFTYTTDFIDTLNVFIPLSDTIARVTDLIATPNYQNQTMELRWQTSNGNFSSFEVYRGLAKIATLQANQARFVADDGGLPGYDYAYRVKPIWAKDRFNVEEGQFVSVSQIYPALLSVQDLNASVLNDVVRINWGHSVDLNLEYFVYRNGDLLEKVSSGERLEVIDATGIVGSIYSYTVVPALANNHTITGPEQSVSVLFPKVEKLSTLTALHSVNGVRLSWDRPSERATHFKIYCNGEVVDTFINSSNGSSLFYFSYAGIPGTLNTYAVSSGYLEGGRYYFGKKTSVEFNHADLAPPGVTSLDPIDGGDQIDVNTYYPYNGIDGIEVFRNGVSIGTFSLEDKQAAYTFEDITGVPEQNYTYSMKAFSTRNGSQYYSAIGISRSAIFPKLSAPFAVRSENMNGLGTVVSWGHKREDVSFEIRRYATAQQAELIATVAGNLRQLKDEEASYFHELSYTVTAVYNGSLSSDPAWSNLSYGAGKGLYYWGSSSSGQLGNGLSSSTLVETPTQLGDENWVRIATGYGSSFAIKADGTLWSWGQNSYGVLGRGTGGNVSTPTQIGVDDDWVDIKTIFFSCIALKSDGSIWTWGRNIEGQLGHGHTNTVTKPTKVGVDEDWRYIEAGMWAFYAIKDDGSLWGAGYNYYGSLASTNHASVISTFTRIGSSSNWRSVHAGSHFAWGMKYDGSLWSWGYNNFGQLGLGHTNHRTSPTRVNSSTYLDVSAGRDHVLAISADGRLWKTGKGTDGQLFSALSNVNTLTVVYNYTGYTFVHSGITNSYTNNPSIYFASLSCGNNTQGLLGLESYANTTGYGNLYACNLPNAKYISSGVSHALGLAEPSFSLTGNFEASKGTYGSKVFLEWDDYSNQTAYEVLLYRDGQLISKEPITATAYKDLTAVPGAKHVYSLKLENKNTGEQSTPLSDKGWRTANGVIKGNVISSIGSQAVPDVMISLKVSNEEGNFYDTTYTDTKGEFRFDEVFYGTLANVEVRASYLDHEFVQDKLEGTLDNTITSLGIGTFVDNTAILIAGNVSRIGSPCKIDSVTVSLVKHYSSKADVKDTRFTNEDGAYAFSVNPYEPDLLSFELVLADSSVKNGKKVWHKWNSNNRIILAEDVSPTLAKQNFVDEIGVIHEFSVRNSCESFNNVKFSVDIQSVDGCYEKTLVSNDNGVFAPINLPPLEYVVNVSGASPLKNDIIPVLDYLSVRPIKLDLTAYATESKGDSAYHNLYYEKRAMVYHNTPDIALNFNSGIGPVACFPNLLKVQGAPNPVDVNVTLSVWETHNGEACHVDEGWLVIKNAGAENPNVRIDYVDSIAAFPEYEFTPGLPATIAPYYKTMIVEYHTEAGFVSQKVYQLLIEGKASQPGSDVIVDKENKDFQIPLAVLRDPPGDNSYSYLEKGVTTTTRLSASKSVGGSFTVSTNNSFGVLGVGLNVSANAQTGGADGKTEELVFSNTTTQRFETSAASDIQTSDATEYLVGDNADMIIGAGMALRYGIVEEIKLFEVNIGGVDSCYVQKSSEIGLSADKLKTTWVYTVTQIEQLIAEYKNALELARQGRLTLTDQSGGGKDTSYYLTLVANWQSVLDYHRRNTLPHYNLCDPSTVNNLEDKDIRSAAKSYQRECFCKYAGTYTGSEESEQFHLDTAFKWTDEMLDRYIIARSAIDRLTEYEEVLTGDKTAPDNYSLPSTGSFIDNPTTVNLMRSSISEEARSYAENITFGGNTSIEKSYNSEYSSASTLTQTIFGNYDLYVGVGWDAKVQIETWVGIGAGSGLEVQELVRNEFEVGLGVEVNFEHVFEAEESTSTSNTSGYVLGDDDAGDQFSVTVIKGLQNSHTPYFELFAGRSSCPYEPGTIPRDRPAILLEYPDGTPFENNVLRDVNVEDPAYFSLKLVNLAPEIFNEPRYYTLIQAANSNINGAQVTADGSGQYYPLVYSIPSGGATYTGFYANKAGISYDYPDLDIQLIPTCFDEYADLTDGFNGASMHLEAYFQRPCSDVSILNPMDNWRIFRSIDQFNNPAERLEVKIGDYDPENEFLETIHLQYRRIGSNSWNDIQGSSVTKDSLQRYYDLYKSVYRDPVYNYVWDVLNQDEIIDGEYELRAVVNCGIEGKIYSNISKGVIDRTALALYGIPKPEDGVLNIGEQVEVVFNDAIECGYETVTNGHYSFEKASDGTALSFVPVCNGNAIVYTYNGDLDDLEGELIIMKVFDVEDLNGNVLTDTVKHQFVVSNTPVSWRPYAMEVDMYQGEAKDIELELINTGAAIANIQLSKSGNPSELLNLNSSNEVIYANAGIKVPVRLSAKNQALGSYDFELTANVSTQLKNYGDLTIPIKVNVLATPPDWAVPTGKSMSAVVICNFQLDNVKSIDTMDRIAITIDNEIRGFDNIYKSRVGTDLYYAVINVQGDAVDIGKKLEYRVWDASSGVEYDGDMTNGDIQFNGGIYGTTLSPRIIDVNSVWDSVRYIPLIEGWNWLAFNYQKESMSVGNMLAGLDLSGGEIIKTLSQQAVYNDSTGTWFNTSNGLSAINTANGYLLYLNRNDVLRASGKVANKNGMSIINGWSLIGNPNQGDVDINSAFAANADLKDGAVLKTGGTVSKASVLDNGLWTGGITNYEVNQSYMIKNSESTVLRFKVDEAVPDQFEYNMTILGSVLFNGNVLQGDGDYVVAYIDDEVRGKGVIEEVFTPSLSYMLNMFIYGDSSDLGKEISFKIYRRNSDEYYTAYTNDSLVFSADLHRGWPNSPYWFSNQLGVLNTEEVVKDDHIASFVYPNPFNQAINVELTAKSRGTAIIQLSDAMGKTVLMTDKQCYKGENTFSIRTEDLSKGMYVLWIELDGIRTAHKILKP